MSKGTMRRPADGRLVSMAGPRSYQGAFGGMHYGVDIGASFGWNIRAAWAGTVTHNYGTGNNRTLVLRHSDGSSTAYLHNSQNLVRVGTRVSQGQVIGKVGTAGTGPHLHFEYHPNGWYTPSQAQINATNSLLRGTRNDGSSNPGGVSSTAPATGGSGSSSSSAGSAAQAGFYRATEAASLHTRADSSSKKVRDVQEGDLLIVTTGARQTEWWLQVGIGLWVQRKRVARRTVGGTSDKLHHGQYPDRNLVLTSERTQEFFLAWQDLMRRTGNWNNDGVHAAIKRWLRSARNPSGGGTGYGVGWGPEMTGEYGRGLKRALRDRGFFSGDVSVGGWTDELTRAEKAFLNDQRRYFIPQPPSAQAGVRAYSGKVY